jgi:hypothetical protein
VHVQYSLVQEAALILMDPIGCAGEESELHNDATKLLLSLNVICIKWCSFKKSPNPR